MEGGAGSAPNRLTFHEAVDPDSPIGATTEDKLSPERGCGYPEVPQHLVQDIPRVRFSSGFFSRKLRTQERVKWTMKGRHLAGAVLDRWAHCPGRALVSYVRNEPASLQHPRPPPPGPAWGTVESLRLTVISPGAALSPCSSLLPVLASAAELVGPRLAPQPWGLPAR